MYVYCLGYNEFLRDAVNTPESDSAGSTAASTELADMPADELLSRIREADGEYVAVAVPDPVRAFATQGTSSTGEIHIISDRFASRPCFYSQAGGRFLFSTNITFLIEMIPGGVSLDPVPLMQLLSIGHTLSGKTTFTEVERVMPAEHLVIENGKIPGKTSYYKTGDPDKPVTDHKALAEQVYSELAASVEKRSRGRKGFVSLSGGLDSRLIAAAADKERFSAFTFINSLKRMDTPEVSVAVEVARKLQLKHEVCPMGETSLISDSIAEVLRLTGGQTVIHHPVKTMSFIRHMQKHGFHMGGGSGGVFAGSEVSSRKIHKSDDWAASYAKKRMGYPDAFLRKMFRTDVHENLPGLLRDSLKASFDRIEAADPARKITLWAIFEGQAAFTFISPIHNHPDVSESSPHLGYRYSDLMLHLTREELVNKNFYNFMIYHCLEDLRDVRYANSNQKLDSKLIARYYRKEWVSRQARLLMKVLRKIRKMMSPARKKSVHFHYEMVHNDRKAIERVKAKLKESAVLQQLCDTGACLAFIRKFDEGHIEFSPEADANVVSFLMTVAYMTEAFPLKVTNQPPQP